MEPVVVRAARRRCEAGVHRAERRHVHGRRREEDREIESLLVHRTDLRLRIEVPRDLLRVAVAEHLLLGVGQRRPVPAHHGGHDFALDNCADVPPPFVESTGGARLELPIDVPLPEIDGLHHVHLGIDHPEPVLRHDLPPSIAALVRTITERRERPRQLRSKRNSTEAFSDVILRRSASGTPVKIRSRNSRDFGHVDSACGKSLPQSMLSTPMTSRSLRP